MNMKLSPFISSFDVCAWAKLIISYQIMCISCTTFLCRYSNQTEIHFFDTLIKEIIIKQWVWVRSLKCIQCYFRCFEVSHLDSSWCHRRAAPPALPFVFCQTWPGNVLDALGHPKRRWLLLRHLGYSSFSCRQRSLASETL